MELRYCLRVDVGLGWPPSSTRRWRKRSDGACCLFDRAAARSFAAIGAARRAAGLPIGHADCQIAAIARSRGASVATRNDGDFEHCGIEVINPWPAPADPDEASTASFT